MATVNIYLNFDGECQEAFELYKKAFGGEFVEFSKFGDMSPQECMPPLSDADKNRIMHVRLPISAETTLYGSDTMPGMHVLEKGNNFSVSITANSEEEANHFFQILSDGGTVTMPLDKTLWNAYFGMWTDKFGVNWMVNYDYPQA